MCDRVLRRSLRELMDATRLLAPSRPALKVVLVGEGPLQDELAERIARDNLDVTLAGAQPPVEVARWMATADLVTLPSYSEGHPNVLVEALACGRPVVSTPVGGIPEVVDAGSGLMVAVRDADALAAGLAAVLDRRWDEVALSRKFSRDWRQVARDTLIACDEALLQSRASAAACAR